MPYTTAAARWRAVSTRDSHSNGCFVYAVHTTRIYCRPTCPARLARRANVSFYDTSELAVAAGFRACKRCRPEEPSIPPDPLAKTAADACKVIERAVKEGRSVGQGKLTLAEIAAGVGLTPRYLHKVFKERMGCTPREYAESLVAAQVSVLDEVAMPASQVESAGSVGGHMHSFSLDDVFDFDAFGEPEIASSEDVARWDLGAELPRADGGFNCALWINDWGLPTATGLVGFETLSDYSTATSSNSPF